jgi:hypothetical protein
MKTNNKNVIKENSVYHSLNEFKDKFLPGPTQVKIVDTDEDAQKLGAQMARESLNNIKFEIIVNQ